MQRFVFRTNYIVKVFIVNIGIPRMVAIFGFGACIGRSQNSTAFKDSFAYPRGLVGAVGGNDFVFGVVLANIIVQRIKRYAVVNVSGCNVYAQNKVVLVARCVRFIGKDFLVFALVETVWTML